MSTQTDGLPAVADSPLAGMVGMGGEVVAFPTPAFTPPRAHEAPLRASHDERVIRSLVPTDGGGPTGGEAVAKRVLDIAVAAAVLLLVLPVLVIASIGVLVSSPGPILFRQERVGHGGRVFTMLKFRSFPVDHADVVQSLPTGACPLWWGRLLRRTSIDELPQLLNVLKGDMSIVGPRPERPQFAAEAASEIAGYRERHRAPAGITGLAQVRGLCGPTSMVARIEADNEYVETWSITRDLGILLRTVPTLLRKSTW
jgi:lipopolysaccharide/colanic/teichoic acid biosynthesis glycosyltransferase